MVQELSDFGLYGFGLFSLFLTNGIHVDHALSFFLEASDKIAKNVV